MIARFLAIFLKKWLCPTKTRGNLFGIDSFDLKLVLIEKLRIHSIVHDVHFTKIKTEIWILMKCKKQQISVSHIEGDRKISRLQGT